MKITISTNNGKIYATPDERMSQELFKAFRANGWLYSGRFEAFCFNDNENGASRVRSLFNGSYLNRVYNISNEAKDEASTIIFEYADEETQQHFEQASEKAKAEQEALKDEKERKTQQANKNKVEQLTKILKATENLKNGWKARLTYGFMCPITTTAEFFERGGIAICDSVKNFAEQFNITIPNGLNIDDNDLLEMKINYDFRPQSLNYFYGGIDPEQKEMRLTVRYYRRKDDNVMTSSSGNFDVSIILDKDLKQRTLAGYSKYAELCGDDVKKSAVMLYINYCLQNNAKAQKTDIFGRVSGNGVINLDEALTLCAA